MARDLTEGESDVTVEHRSAEGQLIHQQTHKKLHPPQQFMASLTSHTHQHHYHFSPPHYCDPEMRGQDPQVDQ